MKRVVREREYILNDKKAEVRSDGSLYTERTVTTTQLGLPAKFIVDGNEKIIHINMGWPSVMTVGLIHLKRQLTPEEINAQKTGK
jgi:hypothetical protein